MQIEIHFSSGKVEVCNVQGRLRENGSVDYTKVREDLGEKGKNVIGIRATGY